MKPAVDDAWSVIQGRNENDFLQLINAPLFQTYLKLPYYEVFLMPSKSPQ
jgi:hypothetical protein